MKDVEKGKKYCEQVLSRCEILRQRERGQMYADRYKVWVKEYENPDFKELTIEPGILGFTLDG